MSPLKREMPATLKLTTDMINEICELLRDGILPRFACMDADISLRSYHRWRKKGKKLFEKRDIGENPKNPDRRYEDAILYRDREGVGCLR